MITIKKYIKPVLLLFGILILPLGFEIIVHLIWTIGGNVIDKPSNEIVLTAQYIYDNPLPTPNSLYFPIHSVPSSRNDICISLGMDDRVKNFNYYSRWSLWHLNGHKLPYSMYDFRLYPLLSDEDPPVSACLELGENMLHDFNILQFDLKLSPFDTGISYQWAIKIEPTGTPTPSATPSAP